MRKLAFRVLVFAVVSVVLWKLPGLIIGQETWLDEYLRDRGLTYFFGAASFAGFLYCWREIKHHLSRRPTPQW